MNDQTLPVKLLRHVPPTAKHPPERSIPLDPVDVADHEIAVVEA